MKEQIDLNTQSSQLTFKRLVQIVTQKRMESRSKNQKLPKTEVDSEIQAKVMYEIAQVFEMINQASKQITKLMDTQEEFNIEVFISQPQMIEKLTKITQDACEKQPIRKGLSPQEEQSTKEKQMQAFIEAYLSQYNQNELTFIQFLSKNKQQLQDFFLYQFIRKTTTLSKRDKKACQVMKKCRILCLKLFSNLINQIKLFQRNQQTTTVIHSIIDRLKDDENKDVKKQTQSQNFQTFNTQNKQQKLFSQNQIIIKSSEQKIKKIKYATFNINDPTEQKMYKRALHWQQKQSSYHAKYLKNQKYVEKIHDKISELLQNNNIYNQLIIIKSQQSINQKKIADLMSSYLEKIRKVRKQLSLIKLLRTKMTEQLQVQKVYGINKSSTVALNQLISFIAKQRRMKLIRTIESRNKKRVQEGKSVREIECPSQSEIQAKVMYEIAQTIEMVSHVSKQINSFYQIKSQFNVQTFLSSLQVFDDQTTNYLIDIDLQAKIFEVIKQLSSNKEKQIQNFIEKQSSQSSNKSGRQKIFPERRNVLQTQRTFTALRKLAKNDMQSCQFVAYLKKKYLVRLLLEVQNFWNTNHTKVRKYFLKIFHRLAQIYSEKQKFSQSFKRRVQTRISQLKPQRYIDIVKIFKKTQKKQEQNYGILKQLFEKSSIKKESNNLQNLIEKQIPQGWLQKLLISLKENKFRICHYINQDQNNLS